MINSDPAARYRQFGRLQVVCIKGFLVILLIGVHTRLSIYRGDAIILPMYLCVFAGGGIAALTLPRRLPSLIIPFAAILLVLVLVAFASVVAGDDGIALIRGVAQVMVSVVLSTGIALALADESMREQDTFFLAFWWVLIVLAAIEVIPAMQPIYQHVSDVIYTDTGRGVYESSLRDMELYGRYRPKVFASEPSFLATSLAVLNALVFITGANRGRRFALVRYLVMFVIIYAVSPSLTSIFYLGGTLMAVYGPARTGKPWVAAALLVMIVMMVGAFQLEIFSTLAGHAQTGSFFGRITAGPPVGMEAMRDRPFFGFGAGNSKSVMPDIRMIWSERGAFSAFPWYSTLGATDLMSNGFWWQWIYLGLLGGTLFNGAILLLLRAMGIKLGLSVLLSVWVVWYAGAAFVDMISWFMFSIFAFAAIPAWAIETPSVPDARGGLPIRGQR